MSKVLVFAGCAVVLLLPRTGSTVDYLPSTGPIQARPYDETAAVEESSDKAAPTLPVHAIFLLDASSELDSHTFSQLRAAVFAGITLLRSQDSVSVVLCRDFVSRKLSRVSVAESEQIIRELKSIKLLGRAEWLGCVSKVVTDSARQHSFQAGPNAAPAHIDKAPLPIVVALTVTSMGSQNRQAVSELLTALRVQGVPAVAIELLAGNKADMISPADPNLVYAYGVEELRLAVERFVTQAPNTALASQAVRER